ncbi:lysosomal proton-coupled steroid conjugate and bile acid symporter SLC46A3-like [Maniola hyperantus]|uniref:lysosomal proton-coupled steroid conjugate and bile acid symporter SLC46A3-like n=1 Tax=Aphantopus hyperantus TaxID=2795564 RepID=UPI0015683BA4|nr:solute carrier family 46 member 3-like [Maniola hyperantus]
MATTDEEPLKKQQNTKDTTKKTLKEKILYIKDNITIEPVFVMYVVTGTLGKLATQNLNLDKACRVNLKYGDKVCDALIAKEGAMYQQEELAIQELVASMEAWKNLILTAIPSLFILFIGAWSDRTGNRKICILLPIVGELLLCLSCILNVYYFKELPVQVAMFFEAFFPAITGGWTTFSMGGFSYISEISSEETRTFRVGLTSLCVTAGGPIGTSFSGILLKYTGYYGVFTTCSLLFCFCIGLGMLCIKHPEKALDTKEKDKVGFGGFLKSFFDINHVKDTMIVAFKSGPNQRRTKSILVLISVVFIYGPLNGEAMIRYLFTRFRFNWDAVKFSIYNTFNIAIHAIGTVVAISLFSRKWQWGDPVLGLISSASKIMGALATGLSRNPSDMYTAAVIEMFNGISFTSLRSMSSKLVSSDELGKMISVFNLTEMLTCMVFGPVYSWIYMVSLKIDSGILFYCSIVLTVPPVIVYSWFYRQDKKDAVKNKIEIISDKERDSDQEFKSKNEPE